MIRTCTNANEIWRYREGSALFQKNDINHFSRRGGDEVVLAFIYKHGSILITLSDFHRKNMCEMPESYPIKSDKFALARTPTSKGGNFRLINSFTQNNCTLLHMRHSHYCEIFWSYIDCLRKYRKPLTHDQSPYGEILRIELESSRFEISGRTCAPPFWRKFSEQISLLTVSCRLAILLG